MKFRMSLTLEVLLINHEDVLQMHITILYMHVQLYF
jgi:hypothetical protein